MFEKKVSQIANFTKNLNLFFYNSKILYFFKNHLSIKKNLIYFILFFSIKLKTILKNVII